MERIRILVADDSTPIQKVIRIAFSKHSVEIECIGSLAEGIQSSRRTNPDLIIFDAGLPGAKGVQDFKDLTQNGRIPAVALLGSYDAINRDDLLQAGFNKILKKPFDSKELIGFAEKLVPGFPTAATSLPPTPLNATAVPPPVAASAIPEMQMPPPVRMAPPPPIPSAPSPTARPTTAHVQQNASVDIEALVEERVLAFCKQHFPTIAREVITAELRRLADEKTRHLVDG